MQLLINLSIFSSPKCKVMHNILKPYFEMDITNCNASSASVSLSISHNILNVRTLSLIFKSFKCIYQILVIYIPLIGVVSETSFFQIEIRLQKKSLILNGDFPQQGFRCNSQKSTRMK